MKKRLDIYLVENNFFESREKARAMIMAGNVYINNQKIDKPGSFIKPEDNVKIIGPKLEFVSRGGLKLKKAIEKFNIDLKNKICVDIGASTGGFTDCMLQNGAKKVFAIDVGYGQLAWKLRTDERVINFERTNIRYFDKTKIPDEIDFISVDVSFISLKLVLPVIKKLLGPEKFAVCLIKPQFEAGKDQVGKKGVVKDIEIHKQVVYNILDFIKNEVGFVVLDLDYSPIKGPEGNIEYLVYIKNSDDKNIVLLDNKINKIIDESHKNL
ncbi:MAG: TlyA family RNA methyltransferase [Oscillospiraceae bacterium]|nr:TlyA family RNA methyltransferase [Oscillospiraceae bacterium]